MTTRPDGSAEERGLRALEFLDRLNTQPDAQTALELSDWMAQSPENEREFVETSTLFHAASLCPRLPLSTEELVARAKKQFASEAVKAENAERADGADGAASAERVESTQRVPPTAQLYQHWNAHGALRREPERHYGTLRRRATPFAIAAGLVTIVAGGIAFYVTRPEPVPPVEYHAAALSRAFTLEDRSFVQLYGQSHIGAAMLEDSRLVKLTGNGAAFKVEHDPRPFQVDVAGLSITAMGTQFNVIRREEEHLTCIYLEDGRLDVRGPRMRPFQMAPGDVVKIHDDGTVERTRADATRLHNRQVDGMTYAEVAAAINRENVIYQIEFRGAASATPARGVVDLADPERWLRLLRSNGLQVKPETGLRIVEAAEPD